MLVNVTAPVVASLIKDPVEVPPFTVVFEKVTAPSEFDRLIIEPVEPLPLKAVPLVAEKVPSVVFDTKLPLPVVAPLTVQLSKVTFIVLLVPVFEKVIKSPVTEFPLKVVLVILTPPVAAFAFLLIRLPLFATVEPLISESVMVIVPVPVSLIKVPVADCPLMVVLLMLKAPEPALLTKAPVAFSPLIEVPVIVTVPFPVLSIKVLVAEPP